VRIAEISHRKFTRCLTGNYSSAFESNQVFPCSTGFSLWVLTLARTKPHRLISVLLV
jgi:hypothetical protein